jgi:hypothetical protein
VRNQAARLLTRHFFDAFFDFGFLSDEGRDSFERALLGSAAVAIGLGLMVARLFLAKYANLRHASAARYLAEVGADHAFLFALTMWIVALAVTLVGDAIFPDEIDLRVLMPEPISQATIFGAKLAALACFVTLFALGAQVSLAPMFLLTMIGPSGTGPLAGWLAAYLIASVAGSAFAALSVIAVNGLMVLTPPLARMAAAVRSTMVFLLVLSLLFVVWLPATGQAFAAGSWWLRAAPPMWFVGLEHWLLGLRDRGGLAVSAAVSLLTAGAVSLAACLLLYRRLPRTMGKPVESYKEPRTRRLASRANAPKSVRRVVGSFGFITLRRSPLHQGVIVTLFAGGAGLVAARFMAAGFPQRTGDHWLLLWSPLALMFIAALAVRLALSIPIDLPANWIFRITERADSRAAVVAASVEIVLVLGVLLPVGAMLPLQWMALGSRTLLLASVELAIGWLYVEVLMRDWRRLPFTCSYVPGKGFVPHMFVKGIAAFVLFTNVGGRVIAACARTDGALPILLVVVAFPALWLLVGRRRAPARPLAFEDHVPSDINPLRLNP